MSSLPPPPFIDLDTEQKQCATASPDHALAIVSPAGSGKTRTLTARIIAMLAFDIPANSILGLTFSRKAAMELRQRIRETGIHGSLCHQLHIYTFHAFALALLRKHHTAAGLPDHFPVYDQQQNVSLVREVISEFLTQHNREASKDLSLGLAGRVAKYITSRKEKQSHNSSHTNPDYNTLFEMYQAKLQEKGALDFSDFVPAALGLLKTSPEVLGIVRATYRHILVDEFQDVSVQQMDLLKLLVNEAHPRITVVGDPNQAIYGFRGGLNDAFHKFFQGFPAPAVHHLLTNYRSTQGIIDFAGAVFPASKGTSAGVKCTKGSGCVPTVHLFDNTQEEVEGVVAFVVQKIRQQGVAPRDIAVLCRVGQQNLPMFLSALTHFNVPVKSSCSKQGSGPTNNGENLTPQFVIASYARLALYDDDQAFLAIFNYPKRGLGGTVLKYLQSIQTEHNVASLFTALTIAARQGYPPPVPKEKASRKIPRPSCLALDELLNLVAQLRRHVSAMALVDFLRKIAELVGIGANQVEDGFLLAAEKFEAQAGCEGPSGMSHAEVLTAFLDDIGVIKSSEEEEEALPDDGAPNCVTVTTVHQAKGLEWPVVFLVRCVEGVMPSGQMPYQRPEEIEEERRMFYVAASRAARELHVSAVAEGPERTGKVSRFLFQIPTTLYHLNDWTREAEERKRRAREVEECHPLSSVQKAVQ